eukprot:5160112-Amphidinium_carterae.1
MSQIHFFEVYLLKVAYQGCALSERDGCVPCSGCPVGENPDRVNALALVLCKCMIVPFVDVVEELSIYTTGPAQKVGTLDFDLSVKLFASHATLLFAAECIERTLSVPSMREVFVGLSQTNNFGIDLNRQEYLHPPTV